MIITRSPLRITLGGGGTDLASYYREHGGFVISAAIDKYVYITLHQTFVPDLIIKYSKLERVSRLEDIEHPIIREALRLVGIEPRYLELASMADIPSGTGLRSPAVSRPRYLRRCTLTNVTWFIHQNWPSRPVTSKSRSSASLLESRINTLHPMEESLASAIWRTGELRRIRCESPKKRDTTWRIICFYFLPAILDRRPEF